MMKTLPVFLIVLVCSCQPASAQSVRDSVGTTTETDSLSRTKDSSQSAQFIFSDTTKDDNPPAKKSRFETSLSYQSNDVYMGRKDSSVLPYFIPEFSYYHKSGIFVSTSLYYLKNQTASRVDLVTIDAGYHFTTGHYDGLLTLSKYFYSSQSTSVTSEISASAEYQNGYDFGFLKTTFTGTLNIGNKLDFAGLFGVEHRFSLLEDKFDITPAFAVGASTQNFYSDYYKTRRYTIKRKAAAGQTALENITGTVVNPSSFKILDYEPSMLLEYTIGKCVISFTPVYSIPVNPALVNIQTTKANGVVTDRTKTEQIENTFFWTLGVSLLF
jgi:hypothetical protein